MNRGVLQPGGFHVIVDRAEFLRDFARDVVDRVFKYNFSPSVLPTEWENARSMVGMTLPAIPTVQSQKSLGFSMPKRERYRPFVLIVKTSAMDVPSTRHSRQMSAEPMSESDSDVTDEERAAVWMMPTKEKTAPRAKPNKQYVTTDIKGNKQQNYEHFRFR